MAPPIPPALQPISTKDLIFSTPIKRIQTHQDLLVFHSSPAYSLITAFIVHLNSSISPLDAATNKLNSPEDYVTSSPSITVSPEVEGITKLVNNLSDLVDSAPPDQGPRRFGNVAFRRWLQLVQLHVGESGLVDEYLPSSVIPAKLELLHYLTHSFGSGERLDYGTGHELSFAAFLCAIWVLGGFQPGRDEKALVLCAFDAYFKLVRRLVTTYSLEPAGSHGVWGLDDHFFLPYIFGSAQLTTFWPKPGTQAAESDRKAEEANLPKPADVVKTDIVNRERARNLYFDAIGFVYDVKKGPFWEHSPILYDISGVQKGWGKINEGMLKMYDNEVLGKFPVVQHFPFGAIFRWSASETPGELAAAKKPEPSEFFSSPMEATRAPWAAPRPTTLPTSALKPLHSPSAAHDTKAPWATTTATATTHAPPQTIANRRGSGPPPPPRFDTNTKAPRAAIPPSPQPVANRRGSNPPLPPPFGADTKAPWATTPIYPHLCSPTATSPTRSLPMGDTCLPWETRKEQLEEDKEASGVNVRTEAPLGPRRTNSPDSAMALAPGRADRRGSLGTGGVRVAETGDLSCRRNSRTG